MITRTIVDARRRIEFVVYAYRALTEQEARREIERFRKTRAIRGRTRYQVFTTIGLEE